ncbi:MAG: prolipoprotein diacylglyceryl transferase, partial [Actinomycetota bacterium]|nr:prolipoprotein diacylglyceryl transferase [Actinomycetota bacterium]
VAVFIVFMAPKMFITLRIDYMWAVYVLGYTLGRLWIELLRSDDATEIFGLRINIWTCLILISISCGTIIYQVTKDPKGHRNPSDVVPHLD